MTPEQEQQLLATLGNINEHLSKQPAQSAQQPQPTPAEATPAAQMPDIPAINLPDTGDDDLNKQLKESIDTGLKAIQGSMQTFFQQQMHAQQTGQQTPTGMQTQDVLGLVVPGLRNVPEDFNNTPVSPDMPMLTWGDYRAKAEETGNVDALKAYVDTYTKQQAEKQGDPEIPSSAARTTEATPAAPQSETQAATDAGLANLLNGSLSQEQFDKQFGATA